MLNRRAVAVLVALLAAGPARATTYLPVTFTDLVTRADVIFVGGSNLAIYRSGQPIWDRHRWKECQSGGCVEVTSQSGTRVHDTTTIKSTAGGGQFGIGPVRDAIEAAVNAAGWQFRQEAGRRP